MHYKEKCSDIQHIFFTPFRHIDFQQQNPHIEARTKAGSAPRNGKREKEND